MLISRNIENKSPITLWSIFLLAALSGTACQNTSSEVEGCSEAPPSEIMDSIDAYWIETLTFSCYPMGDTASNEEPYIGHILEVVNNGSKPVILKKHLAEMKVYYDGDSSAKLALIPRRCFDYSTYYPQERRYFYICESYGEEVYPGYFLCDTAYYASLEAKSYLSLHYKFVDEKGDTSSSYTQKCIHKSAQYAFYPVGELPERLDPGDGPGVIMLPEDYKLPNQK
jgi:hypothetical protein